MKVSFAVLSLLVFPLLLPGETRVKDGLILLHSFDQKEGNTFRDTSGSGSPLDLEIEGNQGWQWNPGTLRITGKTRLRTKQPPARLWDALRKTNELTVEVWLENPDPGQGGPARIVSFSRNISERNFTLGQEKSSWDFRLRTRRTSRNGLPSTQTRGKEVRRGTTHLVFARNRSGDARFYVNSGEAGRRKVEGDFSNWDRNHQLVIANELTGDRPWRGTLHLVAIYDRALSGAEVRRNFEAGPSGSREPTKEELLSRNGQLFSRHIAPLLANQCLECHDASTRKGDLDLSDRKAAFSDGAIIPGSAEESSVWESVDSDEMPHKRPPLSPGEKRQLREWIDGGASWPVDRIDPANYVYREGSADHQLERLTVDEYIATVEDTLGVSIRDEALAILPPDLRADGFSNTAYNLNVDFQHVEAYSRLAGLIAARLDIGRFAARFSKKRNVNDKDMRALILAMGEWVLRGPIESEELDIYRGITTSVVSAGGQFEDAVRHVLEAMLQSPRFLYRIEESTGGGPVAGHELASRISYIVRGTSPDEELRGMGKSGEIYDRDKLTGKVRRMLDSPRARERCLAFAGEWLHLDRLENLRPNRKRFPNWDGHLAGDMKAETLAFYEDVVWKRREPMTRLMNEPSTFLTPRLASHYGLKFDGSGEKNGGLVRHDLGAVPHRGGLLTQGAVLTIGGDEASMVTRGLFVLQDVLRSVVKDPPPCVDTTPVSTRSGLTQRGIAEERISRKSCGGCHEKFEPLAFGLEKYDGLGGFHERDHHGNRLREDGEILFPGSARPVAYETAAEMMDLLAESARVRETIVWKLTQFALGRPLRSDDLPVMEKIIAESTGDGGTYHAIIEAIVLSDLVQLSPPIP